MNSTGGTKIKKPVSVLKKSLKIEFKELAKAAGKAALHVSTGQWESVAEDGADILGSVGVKSTPQEVGWLLVYRAICRALQELINEAFETEASEYIFNDLLKEVNAALSGQSLIINKKFFEKPEAEPVIEKIKPAFVAWLIKKNIAENAALSISDRLSAYFAMSLHNEWAASPNEYSLLQEGIDTPFTKASERLKRWSLYEAALLKQVEEPMFNESFSLKRVFVSPRAFYIKKKDRVEDGKQKRSGSSDVIRVVIDLKENLDAWLQNGSSDDSIRLLSGGPGSGKSSFAKIYAASLSRRSDSNVIFIPLHHFEPSADLIEAVGRFLQTEGLLIHNPLDSEYRDKRLVIIFDGLDELAMQGKVAERTAQDFVREVQRKAILLNQQKNWLKVIISGRELIVQQSESDFRKSGQILHLLPYYVEEEDREKYVDVKDILLIDQRDVWWQNYGVATGSNYKKLPEELAQGHLVEITSQPLLNYLVALSLKRGQLKFSEETNLNAVYADLLRAIYDRGWSKQQHLAIQGIEEADFSRILEEIALAAWHGDGRKTTVREIENHCNNSNLQSLLSRFQTGLEQSSTAKVTQLLTAFYFRQNGQDIGGEKTFEFTHKSFSEFLTARRIVRETILMHDQLKARSSNHDIGWSERDCLKRWLNLCGTAAIDQYLFDYIIDEFRLIGGNDNTLILEYQKLFCRLFEYVIKEGMPLISISGEHSLRSISDRARKAEEALFFCLNACARITKKISKIDWPDASAFGDWFAKEEKRTFEQRPSLLSNCLSYLDLRDCNLMSLFLYMANFSHSNLDGAKLIGSDIRYSKVTGALMNKTNFAFANLAGTNFQNGSLNGADFEHALIQNVDFLPDEIEDEKSTFEGASLEEAKFFGCDLRNINFSNAKLKRADFRKAILLDVSFENADLSRADFNGAMLNNINLVGANMSDMVNNGYYRKFDLEFVASIKDIGNIIEE